MCGSTTARVALLLCTYLELVQRLLDEFVVVLKFGLARLGVELCGPLVEQVLVERVYLLLEALLVHRDGPLNHG